MGKKWSQDTPFRHPGSYGLQVDRTTAKRLSQSTTPRIPNILIYVHVHVMIWRYW